MCDLFGNWMAGLSKSQRVNKTTTSGFSLHGTETQGTFCSSSCPIYGTMHQLSQITVTQKTTPEDPGQMFWLSHTTVTITSKQLQPFSGNEVNVTSRTECFTQMRRSHSFSYTSVLRASSQFEDLKGSDEMVSAII